GDLQHLGFKRAQVFRQEVARFLGGNFSELDDRIDDRLEATMAERNGTQHDFFRKLLSFGFNHQNGVRRTGDNEVELRLGHLVEMRVQNVLAIDVANACRADRAHEWNAGQRQSCRGGNHRNDVRIVLEVVLQNGHNNLRVVLVAFHEERADRAVDQAGNARLVFARTAFTLEVAAGDLARSERLFLVVDGEREEILARLRLLRRNDGGENDGLTVGGQ